MSKLYDDVKELPPMPGTDEYYEDEIDFKDVPIRVSIKDQVFYLNPGEAAELVSRVTNSLEVWLKANGR